MKNLSRHGGYPPWALYSGSAGALPFFIPIADSDGGEGGVLWVLPDTSQDKFCLFFSIF